MQQYSTVKHCGGGYYERATWGCYGHFVVDLNKLQQDIPHYQKIVNTNIRLEDSSITKDRLTNRFKLKISLQCKKDKKRCNDTPYSL
jgi:hypothetical protein